MKKLVFSMLIVAVGLTILAGVAIAKDQLFAQVLPDESPPAVALIGEAVGITTGGLQSRSRQSESYTVEQSDAVVASFDASVQKPTEFEGSVSAVDLNDGLFDVSVVGSDLSAFTVDSDTVFEGGITSIEDLTSDMQVSIVATQEDSGSWRVISIINHTPVAMISGGETSPQSSDGSHDGSEYTTAPKINVGGRVTAVGADTLTIQTQGGTPMTFAIGESTIFSSYLGTHDSLEDIKVNFTVSVIYYEDEYLNGLRLAYRVVVSNEGIAFNAHQQGWVTEVGASAFTITTNWGTVYTFSVDGSTQVKGVGSFAEITTGMRAFVYYQDLGGSLLAKGIQVWP